MVTRVKVDQPLMQLASLKLLLYLVLPLPPAPPAEIEDIRPGLFALSAREAL